ncbi:MAG: hypothetical protein KGH75_11870 [Rhodospirillales bacterium]|nr:hypothetical protein [Rhodospirillales bacterium]
MIPGAVLKFGDTEYTVPPINLRISYMPEMEVICKPEGEVPFLDYVKAASTVLFALMQRNYPDMTRDQFNDIVDLPLLKPVMAGMLQVSGYAARPLEAKAEPVEAPAEPSLSDSSTAPPDGSPTTSSSG